MLLNDRYRFIRQLAQGGCAATFLAEDQYLPSRRKCVIKQFKPSNGNATAASEIRAKFKKEAEVLEVEGMISFPNCTVCFKKMRSYTLSNNGLRV